MPKTTLSLIEITVTSLVVQWLRSHVSMQVTWFHPWSELRSHIPWGSKAQEPQLESPCVATGDPVCCN